MPHRKRERDLLHDFQATRTILAESLDMLEQAHLLLEQSDRGDDALIRAAKYRIGLVHEKVSSVRNRLVTTARSIAAIEDYVSFVPSEMEAELRAVDAELLSELEPPALNPEDPRGDLPSTDAE